MRLKGLFTFLLVVVCACSFAQPAGDLTQSRILVLLDGSSSMTLPWKNGKIKYNAAKELILKLMDSVYTVNKDVEFSLRVFGHQYTVPENNCYDTRNEVPFRRGNRIQMELRLDDIQPRGVTSIAYSLKQAAENDLIDIAHNAYSIILITDGGESCGGDICEVMRMLIKNKVFFKPYIISLENVPELKKEYDCMGDYLQVTTSGDIPIAVGTIVEAFKPALKITKAEYNKLQTIAASAPSVLKVNMPPIKMDSTPAPKPVWSKPAVEKIDNLAHVYGRIAILQPAHNAMKTRFVPQMPEIIPEPEPVKRVSEKITKVSFAPSRPLSYTLIKLSKLKEVYFPPLVFEFEVEPEPVKHLPENITRVSFASSRQLSYTTAKLSKLNAVAYDIDIPEIQPEPALPTPEAIGRLTAAKVKTFKTTSAQTLDINTRSVPAMPEIKEEVVLPAAETINRRVVVNVRPVNTSSVTTPKPKTVAIPQLPEIKEEPVRPAAENISQLATARMKTVGVFINKIERLKPVAIPRMPDLAAEVERPAAENITHLTSARLKTFAVNSPAPANIKSNKKTIPLPAIVVEEPPVTLPPPAKIARLDLKKLRTMPNIWVIEERALTPVRVPALPKIKIETAPLPTAKPTPAPPLPPGMKAMERTVETEDANETTLEVYFTNGKGKYFATTPQIFLLEPSTGKLMKKFYRFVDGNGNPDPQKNISPGTYNLTFADKPSLVVPNIKIEANKRNKVVVKIVPATLSFAYAEASNPMVQSKRPVTEFMAVVIERNKDQGSVVNQKCSDRLEYEPGNYHIRINTFPEEVRNQDLTFDELVVTIQQPGFAKFTNDGKLQKVTLWKRLGDKFVGFYALDLRDPQSQHLRIQPGEYQVHYAKGPAGLTTADKVKMFVIKPTQITEIILD